MTLVYLDFESRSWENLRTAGLDRYMTRAEPTIATWSVERGPVRIWDMLHEKQPKEFTNAITDPTAVFIAHNAPFDRAIMQRHLLHFTPASRWWCTRAQAYAHGLPGGLDALCDVLNVGVDHHKSRDGARLIQLFCVPHKGRFYTPEEYPDDWEAFKNYAMRDIDALRAVHARLPTHNFTGSNLRYFWLTTANNERGFAIDLPLIEATVDMLQRAKGRGDEEVARLTAGAVSAVTQRDKLLAYLLSRGVKLPNLRKSELEAALQDDYSPEIKLLIAARLEGARASGAKYKKAIAQHVGGRLRYTMQFSGAGRTGRTAHKGFQPGNMPLARTFNPLAETLAKQHPAVEPEFIDNVLLPAIRNGSVASSLVFGGPNTGAANALRHAIIAEAGNELVVADYKNIESRVLAWLAGEQWKLDAYRAVDLGKGDDLYRLLYSRFFGRPIDSVSFHERQAGKVIELACGFGGSVGAFVTMAVGYGMVLDDLPALVIPSADERSLRKAEQVWRRAFLSGADYGLRPEVFQACHVLVQKYRASNPRIDELRRYLGRVVEGAVRVPERLYEFGRCRIWAKSNEVLIVELPSGYRLYYWQPLIESEKQYDPETGEEEERTYLSFKRARGGKMIRERSWPGLTLENIVQATANQVLRYGELEVDAKWPGVLVLDVHDEAVAEAPVGLIDLKEYEATLCKGWRWCEGLPLAADGWVGPRYGKR